MVSGDFTKYNQAVLTSEQQSISETQQMIDERKSELSKEKYKLEKGIRAAAVAGGQYSIESIIIAKRQLRDQELLLNRATDQVSNVKKQIASEKSEQQLAFEKYNQELSKFKEISKEAERLENTGNPQDRKKAKQIYDAQKRKLIEAQERKQISRGKETSKQRERRKEQEKQQKIESNYSTIEASLEGFSNQNQVETIKTTRNGKTTISTTTRERVGKPREIPERKTYITTKPIESEKNNKLQTEISNNFGLTAGREFQKVGDKGMQFQIDDSPESFGYGFKKKIETGVQTGGALVGAFGQVVSGFGATLDAPSNLVKASEKRSKDGDFTFADAIFSIGEASYETTETFKRESPELTEVVDRDLNAVATGLESGASKLSSIDFFSDETTQKVQSVKSKVSDFGESLSDKGSTIYAVNRNERGVIPMASAGVGILTTLAGETIQGIANPVKTAKVTENAFANVQTDNKAFQLATNTGEVFAGGGAYAGEIISDPKTYIAGELIEGAQLARNPSQRGGAIVESIALNPKDFLKASIGETIFVTGAFTLGKAGFGDLEVGAGNAARASADELGNLAQTPKSKQSQSERTFVELPSGQKIESVSLDSVGLESQKPQTTPRGVVTNGEFAYKTNVVEIILPKTPIIEIPDFRIGRNTEITPAEVGFTFDYDANNITRQEFDFENRSEFKNPNIFKSELKFDDKYDFKTDNKSELKFDDKYDFRTDNKTDTKTDFKFDEKTDTKFDYKFDYKYDNKFDEKTDERTDFKLKFNFAGRGKSGGKLFDNFSNKDGKRYINSLGGALLSKSTKNPLKDITGLKIRAIKLK